jgi:hypothetical protein
MAPQAIKTARGAFFRTKLPIVRFKNCPHFPEKNAEINRLEAGYDIKVLSLRKQTLKLKREKLWIGCKRCMLKRKMKI